MWLTGKGDRTGTNIAKAYKDILESMKIEQETNKEDFMQTQHIVIMFTDGIDDNIYTWWLPLKLLKCQKTMKFSQIRKKGKLTKALYLLYFTTYFVFRSGQHGW